MIPIPQSAKPDDPRWAYAYMALANSLVMAGARAKIIVHLTAVPLPKVSQLYRALRGTAPPSGPVLQGHARFFSKIGRAHV